jgi:hypothetical protein
MESNISFSDARTLLQRDWFMDDDDIHDLLWSVSQEVYLQVYAIRYTFSRRIRDAFYCYEPMPPSRVRDLPYEKDVHMSANKEAMKSYVPPPRPRTIWDDDWDTLTAEMALKPRIAAEITAKMETLRERREMDDKLWHELQWICNRDRYAAFADEKHTSL